jgi:hypothetical protein
MLFDLNKKPVKLSASKNIKKILCVCSHERSGTHFLMNSISINSNYSVNPFLNFDLIPFGDMVNFYSPTSVENFINQISSITHLDQKYKLSSIIKSHHCPLTFKNLFDNPNIVFLYIYRRPIDVFVSFKNFVDHWNWNEGPKKNTLFEFITSSPEGQMQRYQEKSYNNLFLRWAWHVNNWLNICSSTNNVLPIYYEELKINYENTLHKIFDFLQINYSFLKKPSKDDYIKTIEKNYIDDDYEKSIDFINSNLRDFPDLRKIFV